MRTRWMLLTAAGLAVALGACPPVVLGQPDLPAVPPLPSDQPAVPPTIVDDVPTEPVAPSVPVIEVAPALAPPVLPAGPIHHEPSRREPETPPIVRPRYGSVLTNGAYMPVPIPPRPAGTRYWQPGGPEGRAGSPYYYTAPGQDGPLYVVHGRRGVPWGYNHSVFEYHFGPGYYRDGEAGHYRFPYYTYRAPWYSPGPPIYNRFTNLPW